MQTAVVPVNNAVEQVDDPLQIDRDELRKQFSGDDTDSGFEDFFKTVQAFVEVGVVA